MSNKMKKCNKITIEQILNYYPLFAIVSIGIILTWMADNYIMMMLSVIIAVFYYKDLSVRIIKIIIDGDNVVFVQANGKELSCKLDDVIAVQEVGIERGFHEEVLVQNLGSLHITNLLVGVEVVRNGVKHRGIELKDFPYSQHDVY